MIDDIQALDEPRQKGVFNIIKKHTKKYTENQNGVFIDMMKLEKTVLDEIMTYLGTQSNITDQHMNGIPLDLLNDDDPEIRQACGADDGLALNLGHSDGALEERLTDEEKMICGLDYSSSRKKDLHLIKKKVSLVASESLV